MRNEDWSATRIAAALAKLEDTGLSQPRMARLAGVSQSTVNRWSRGRVQPGYAAVRKLAVAMWPRHPDLARELVEASGYAWAEPSEAPPPDVLADELGQDTADRVRRELARRGEAGAVVLAEFERVLRQPASGPSASERSRAASLPPPSPAPARPCPCPAAGRRCPAARP